MYTISKLCIVIICTSHAVRWVAFSRSVCKCVCVLYSLEFGNSIALLLKLNALKQPYCICRKLTETNLVPFWVYCHTSECFKSASSSVEISSVICRFPKKMLLLIQLVKCCCCCFCCYFTQTSYKTRIVYGLCTCACA